MKISIEQIKKEKTVVLNYEDEQFKNKNLRYQTKDALQVSITLSLAGTENVRIKGEITGKFCLICDRCCSEFIEDKKFCFDEIMELEQKEIVEHVIDVDSKIKEIVIMNFPMKILCSSQCKGICQGCGVNLNQEECKCKK